MTHTHCCDRVNEPTLIGMCLLQGTHAKVHKACIHLLACISRKKGMTPVSQSAKISISPGW